MPTLKRYRPCKTVDECGNQCGIQSADGFDFCDECLDDLLLTPTTKRSP